MKKKLAIALLSMLGSLGAQSQCLLDKTNWTLVFDEEFNTNLSDVRTRFNFLYGPDISGNNNMLLFDTVANFSMSNGLGYFYTKRLTTPITYNGQQIYYTGCNILTKIDDLPWCSSVNDDGFLYGMFEVRCKLPSKPKQFTSFWSRSKTAWPPEIDAFELNSSYPNRFFSTVHWGPNAAALSCANYYETPYSLTNDYHTWTVVWTPTKITWFLDNRELKTEGILERIPGAISSSTSERCKWMKMRFQMGTGLNSPDGEVDFDPVIVDYIKVYKPSSYTAYTSGDIEAWYNNVKLSYANTPYKTTQEWFQNRIRTTQNYDVISDFNVLQNGGKFYYVGASSLLWVTYWQSGQFYSTPIDWSYTIKGDISVAKNNEVVFFTRTNNRLYYLQDNQFREIKNLNYTTNVSSNVISLDNGLEVIYRGADNNIWRCTRTSLTSHSWQIAPITNTGNIKNEIVRSTTNSNYIYYITTQNTLSQLYFNGTSWVSSQVTAGASSSLAKFPDRDKILFKSSAGELSSVERASSSSSWGSVQTVMAISPYSSGMAFPINNINRDLSPAINPDKIFYIGNDGRVWNIYNVNNVWYNAPMNWLVSNARLLKLSEDFNNLKVCIVGDDNQIRTANWTTCEVLNPACGVASDYQLLRSSMIYKSEKDQKTGGIEVYPNPATDAIQIVAQAINIADAKNVEIKIFDLAGFAVQEVYKESIHFPYTISLSNLRSGIYMMKVVIDGKETFYKKISKI